MRPTPYAVGVGTLLAGLSVLAVVLARPLVLVGSVLVGAWLVSRMQAFGHDLERTARSLSVAQSPASTAVRPEGSTPVTLDAELDAPSPLSLSVTGGVPTAARADGRLAVDLEAGERRASTSVEVEWPIAGRHAFDAPTVRGTDGCVTATVTGESGPTVTVEPPGVRSLHLGRGGERLRGGGEDGAHASDAGIEVSGVREYVPGDEVSRIDWKATTRLASTHVREFDARTSRRAVLVVDHRASLGVGPPDGTKLAFLRAVALATVATLDDRGTPVGLVAVGDEGITERLEADSAAGEPARIRRHLLDLEPTADPDESRPRRAEGRPRWRAAATGDARRLRAAVRRADDAFGETLAPFVDERGRYRHRVASDPLVAAVRAALAGRTASCWLAIFTDDANPAELREAVSLARRGENAVTAVLAPTVLYEPGGLADVDRAYRRYVTFEEFRRDLSRFESVTALEVGPGDRLATVLSAGGRGGRP